MKLRIRGNSLRLRLTRPEVDTFAASGFVEEHMFVAPQMSFVYRITCAKNETENHAVSVKMMGNTLEVCVPKAIAQRWTSTEEVGFEAEQNINTGRAIDEHTNEKQVLKILIEKDFACLKPRDEDDTGAFPNPQAC